MLATELGLALASRGHEIHFFAYENPIRLRSFQGNVYYHQVCVPEYPLFKYPPYALALATKLADVVEHHELDVVHVHYALPHAVSGVLAREMTHRDELKIVVTLHGTDITIVGTDPSYRRATRFGIERADAVTAVSHYLADETQRIFGTKKDIAVVPNFVDLDRFRATPCPEANALRKSGEQMLVHVSNFRPVKRVLDLVEAFARLSTRREVRLLMVGDGPDQGAAQQRAQDLGVGERVHFLGSQEAVERILPCGDVFVLPSQYESFGLAALEAMACEVPVVATRGGGIPEVVEDGVSGRLFRAGDVGDLAAVLDEVLSDEPRRRRMAVAARERAKQSFSMTAIVEQYERVYRDVLVDVRSRGAAR